VTGRDLLKQLHRLNQDCQQALEEENFYKFKALMQLKKDLLRYLSRVPFEVDDIELVKEALHEEERLAHLALAKKDYLEAKVNLKTAFLH